MHAPDLLRAERDALGLVGLLAYAYLTWDPPIPAVSSTGRPEITHFGGLNIQALVVDNCDGEVLGLAKNSIHRSENPTSHAEPAAVEMALQRLRVKRPRGPGVTVDNYYREELFYAPGRTDADYTYRGCTLYTSLEPCPMCTATLCVARMKRIVYLIPDERFGGSFLPPTGLGIKDYYPSFELQYEQLVTEGATPFVTRVAGLHRDLMTEIEALRGKRVRDTLLLDHVHPLLARALAQLVEAQPTDLASSGPDLPNASRTLTDLKRLCRLP